MVLSTEVQALKAALKQFNESIELVFVIVSKRINTKFTSRKPETNPNSGTVVDESDPARYDFLVSSRSEREL